MLLFIYDVVQVRGGDISTNKSTSLYSTDSYVVSIVAGPDGRSFVAGHLDGSIVRFNFEDAEGKFGSAQVYIFNSLQGIGEMYLDSIQISHFISCVCLHSECTYSCAFCSLCARLGRVYRGMILCKNLCELDYLLGFHTLFPESVRWPAMAHEFYFYTQRMARPNKPLIIHETHLCVNLVRAL